jgi:preprotein translocase subunit SecB
MNDRLQPRIFTDSIMLVKSVFNRYPVFPGNMHTNINLAYSYKLYDENNGHGELTLECTGESKENGDKVFDAVVQFLGVFRGDADNPNMPLEHFLKNQAPGHIYPYAREYLTSLSTRSGMQAVILPPLNIASVLGLELEADLPASDPISSDISGG